MSSCDRGCSAYTSTKLQHIRGFIRMHIPMAYGAMQSFNAGRKPYVAIDLNGGWGEQVCSGEKLKGSPLILAEELEAFGAPYELYVFERDPDAVASLHQVLGPQRLQLNHGTIEIIPGDHFKTAPVLAERLSERLRGVQFGIVVADPYGQFKADAMRSLLTWGDKNRLDGLISVPTTAHKRNGCRPLDEIRAAGRPNVWVRNPVIGADGGWNWTIAFVSHMGSSGRKWDWAAIDMYPTDSLKGREIAYRLNTTKDERLNPKAPSRIAATRNTSDIPGFGLSVPTRSRAREVSASDAAPGQLRFIT